MKDVDFWKMVWIPLCVFAVAVNGVRSYRYYVGMERGDRMENLLYAVASTVFDTMLLYFVWRVW